MNVAFISERTTERTNAPTHTTWLSVEIQGPWLSGEIHGRYGYGTDAYPRENCIAPDGECSFIGQRHYTGFSGEILGRYGHDTGAYPRENCIAPDIASIVCTTNTN